MALAETGGPESCFVQMRRGYARHARDGGVVIPPGPSGRVPFTNGQVFTLTGEASDGVSEALIDRSYIALVDILVFDPAMNPLGTVTSGPGCGGRAAGTFI